MTRCRKCGSFKMCPVSQTQWRCDKCGTTQTQRKPGRPSLIRSVKEQAKIVLGPPCDPAESGYRE